MKINEITKNNKGFTLIETLVSLALFSVVLVIVGGVIVSIIDINRKNQEVSAVVNNLNYSIDSMVRDIKTGYLYKCGYEGDYTIDALKNSDIKGDSGNNPCTSLVLVSTISGEDTVVKYELKSADGENNYIEKTVYGSGGGAPYNVTDKKNVTITDLNFTVKNPNALDSKGPYGQPSVFVSIKGKAGDQTIEASKFFIQTLISQRLINVTNFKN